MRVEFHTFPDQVVSDVLVRRVFPLLFIFAVLFSEMSVLWPMDATVFIQGAAQGVPRLPFLQFLPSLGLHFGSLGGPLGYILAKLVASGAPGGPQCPHNRPKLNFPNLSPHFLVAFWIILVKIDKKNRSEFGCEFNAILKDFWVDLRSILRYFLMKC